MKKAVLILVFFFCFSLVIPLTGEAGRYYYGGGCGGGCGDYWVPAAIIGGSILLGALFVGTMSRPPAQPAARPMGPPQPYASPDPNFVAKYGQVPAPSQRSGGEWVTVPAQQVGGTLVPAHRVFVPNR